MATTPEADPIDLLARTMGGPCPFAEGDPRREVWLTIGRLAREAEARLQAGLLAKVPEASADALKEMVVDAQVQRFDYANRLGILTVTDYQSAARFEDALDRGRTYLLGWFKELLRDKPDWLRNAGLVERLRLRLNQRVAHWTAEALAAARGEPQGRTNTVPNATVAPLAESSLKRPLSKGNKAVTRRVVVEPLLTARGWSRAKWAVKAGVDPSVVYAYLKGSASPRAETRKALAESLGLEANQLPE